MFCGDHLLAAYLRPADIDPARHSLGILKLLVARMRRAWPGVRIAVRADSGFCRWRLMRWCERHDVGYILGLARNARLAALAAMALAEAGFAESGEKQRRFADLTYGARSWDRERRAIARIEHGPRGANPRFVVTNLAGEGRDLYERLYCARGEMENRIKEQQLQLFADRTSCRRWWPNQFRLLLASLAYGEFTRVTCTADLYPYSSPSTHTSHVVPSRKALGDQTSTAPYRASVKSRVLPVISTAPPAVAVAR